ncbi:MAG: altronate dehydratase family protein [Bacteroidota bacterium]
MKNKAITIDSQDNAAVALIDLKSGSTVSVNGTDYLLKSDIKAKHKFALKDLAKNEDVWMYGIIVGVTTENIKLGEAITVNNIKHKTSKVEHKTASYNWEKTDISKWEGKTFDGFKRSDGQVGTRNIWLFFPLVFCENNNIEILKDTFEKELGYFEPSKYQNLLRSYLPNSNTDETSMSKNFLTQRDNNMRVPSLPARRSQAGDRNIKLLPDEKAINENSKVLKNIELKFITHPGGCGAIRQDALELSQLLAGYLNNPNVAGATVLSLGCQNLQIDIFQNSLKKINPDFDKPVLIYEQQQIGTAEEMLNSAIKDSITEILKADKQEREPAPLSNLSIGLQCGGSDGFSGISANPLLGYVSDVMASIAGTVVLAEFPELCGVEQDIVNRCVNEADGVRFLELMRDYEDSVIASGTGFDANPSPGNIKDGLITDAMKSAGAAKKGGSSPIVSVKDYGEYISEKGLSLLCTPGNDVESTTLLAGAGSNIILFTTGLGTPTGNPVTPVIKVSSNSELANKMSDIIDFNSGEIITGEKSISEVGEELISLIIDIASGKVRSKATINKQNDFIPWRRGVSL